MRKLNKSIRHCVMLQKYVFFSIFFNDILIIIKANKEVSILSYLLALGHCPHRDTATKNTHTSYPQKYTNIKELYKSIEINFHR